MRLGVDAPGLASDCRLAVLGGCGGIGRALVSAAQARGAQVCVLDLKISIERHPPPTGVEAIEVDATQIESLRVGFQHIASKWQALDGFVNLCGFMHENEPLENIPLATLDEIVAGNLRSVVSAAQLAVPLLRRGRDASLVNAASGLAQFIRPGFGAYAVAKAGVIAATKTLALENAPLIRANAVAPAAVDTAFLRGGTGRSDESDDAHLDLTAYTAQIPMQRMATVDDIVGPTLFLLSDASRFMTGQVLWINGGAYMP